GGSGCLRLVIYYVFKTGDTRYWVPLNIGTGVTDIGNNDVSRDITGGTGSKRSRCPGREASGATVVPYIYIVQCSPGKACCIDRGIRSWRTGCRRDRRCGYYPFITQRTCHCIPVDGCSIYIDTGNSRGRRCDTWRISSVERNCGPRRYQAARTLVAHMEVISSTAG